MIETHNLTKRYGIHTAIQDISFEAKPGEIVGLLGPNGAGKTTTMRILTGFMPPTSGNAVVAGYDVMADSMAVRQRVGYMPEHVPLYPDMTVRAFITFWAKLRGTKQKKSRVDYVLERFALTDRQNQLVGHLSKGLKQRVGLAQAIVHDPEVVILDEPTIGIDPQQVIEVRQLVRELREEHTVLFSSHILSEVEHVCDRVIIINKGQIVASGTTEMLSKELKTGMRLYVALEGAGRDKAIRTLKGISGIRDVTRQGEGYVVVAESKSDIRAEVARAISQQGWTLLEMRPLGNTLEDIFLDVVSREQH